MRDFSVEVNFYSSCLPGRNSPPVAHGLSGYQGPMWDAWQQQSLEWFAEQRLIQNPHKHWEDGQNQVF